MGHWGLSETEKTTKISIKTAKPKKKIAQNRKIGENGDPNHEFILILKPLMQQRNIGFIYGVYMFNKLTGLTRLLRFSWCLSVAHNVTTAPGKSPVDVTENGLTEVK